MIHLFRRRPLERIRVHLRNADPSIEGFLWRPYPVDGCYRLMRARLVENEDRSFDLEGEVDIPATNVLFLQRLGADR